MKKKLLGGVLALVGLVAIGLVTMAPSTYDFGAGVLDNGATTEILVGGGAGSAPVWTTATGTGAPARAGSPTFTTQITTPKVLGGTGTTQDLDLQTTSGVGTTGADMHFKVGNNGATEAMTILNSGYVGIGTTGPPEDLSIKYDGHLAFCYSAAAPNTTYHEIYHDNAGTHALTFDSYYSNTTTVEAFHFNGSATAGQHDRTIMTMLQGGNVGIGTATPNQKLTIEGTMSLKEQAAANADVAAYGQVWVANSTPNELWFTDDAGTDTQLSSHALDAPEALYTYGPGIDWIGKRVQHYLGIVFWQKIDGTVVEETFDEYNARTKDFDGHTDLVKLDWDTDQLAKLKAQKKLEGKDIAEEEVPADDAFESVEITEDVQSGESDTKYSYKIDNDGKVSVTSTEIPTLVKNKTGKFKKQLKSGITFSDKTGKFMRSAHHRELTDDEVEALNLEVPEMPKWMQDWKLKKEKETIK